MAVGVALRCGWVSHDRDLAGVRGRWRAGRSGRWSIWHFGCGDARRGGGSEAVEEAEERAEPWVVGEDAPPDAPAGGDDLAGDLDERGEEGAEVHGQQPPALLRSEERRV